jgi:pyruvate formate lyase activating enzyme
MDKGLFVSDYQHVSLIEYPGKISSIIFTHGCNLRCRYCHNPELVTGKMRENRMDDFLEYLKGKDIEAVAVTGGEPLFSAGLPCFLAHLKGEGFSVKLDTNGMLPSALEKICRKNLIDYAAVDVKAFSTEDLRLITRTGMNISRLHRSLEVLDVYKIPHEMRHTLWKTPSEEDVVRFAEKTSDAPFYLQKLRKGKTLDKSFACTADFEKSAEILSKHIKNLKIRT